MMHTKQATTPPAQVSRHPTPAPDFAERRRRALEAARRVPGPIDALIVSDPHNIHYLTGVHEGIFWLALSDQSPFGISRHHPPSPPSDPARRPVQGPPVRSKFLAITL